MPRVTMAVIAQKVGVSKNTVSLALRHDPQISPQTRDRVLEIAKELGYARNPVVSQLMSELRKSQPVGYRRTIALINGNEDRQAFTKHPTIPAYVAGCRRRAEFQGYRFDEFWLHDPQLNGDRLNRILQARGIRGALVVGMMKQNLLPERFAEFWPKHACVVTGVRTRNPTLPFSCVDHHALVMLAMEHAQALGYKRPGLVVDERIDHLVDGRFSSGMWVGQQTLAAADRVPGFYEVESNRGGKPQGFLDWLHANKPDVVFTLYNFVRRWLEESAKLRVPEDIGLVQLERRADTSHWAGMEQHNDITGEAAVDMLVSMLHNNETGVPDFPRATLVSGSWVSGETVRDLRMPQETSAKVR